MNVSTPLTVWPTTSSALREILEVDSGARLYCHGMLKSGKRRCQRKGSKVDSDKVTGLLNQVFSEGSLESARYLLGDLAKLLLCHDHQDEQKHGWVAKWAEKLEPMKKVVAIKTEKKEEQDDDDASGFEDLPEHDCDTIMTVHDSQVPEVRVKNETPVEDVTLIDANTLNDGPQTRPSSPAPSKIPTSPSSTTLKSTGPKHIFKQFSTWRSTETLNREVKKLISRTLLPKEKKSDGRIYIFTFPASYRDVRPYLKIGYAQHLNTRMNSWERKCKYKPRVLTDTGAECYVKVEKLVHKQLWNQRKRESGGCPECKVEHDEWFDVTWAEAAATVALWADWMRQEPYDEQGVLREEWKTRLEEVDLSDPRCWNGFVNGEKVDDSGYDSASEAGD